MVLFSANEDAKAWKQIEIALMKASYIGHRINIARALQYMGYGYLRRGDYQNAYGAYEAAAERSLGTVDARVVELCKDNMARIEQKQGNPDTVVGFYRPSVDVDKQTLFYPPIQASTSELPISGS
jgi:tetratricopeptide (TPR) repeat protein